MSFRHIWGLALSALILLGVGALANPRDGHVKSSSGKAKVKNFVIAFTSRVKDGHCYSSELEGEPVEMAHYGRVVRWSIALTSVVAAVAVVISALVVGSKGIYGALIGVGVVVVFFGISILVVGKAAKVSPMAMMVAALGSFVFKIVAFAIVLVAIGHSTAFNGRSLGFTALACILAWSAAQAVAAMRMQTLYVEPDGQS